MANTFTALTGGGAGSAYQAGDKFGYQTAEKIRQNFNALAELGSPMLLQAGVVGLLSTSYADHPYYVDLPLNGDDLGGLTVEIDWYSRSLSTGTSVQMRLRNITDSSDTAESASVTSTSASFTKETETVTLASGGMKTYRLQLKGSDTTHAVEGYAVLRIRKT